VQRYIFRRLVQMIPIALGISVLMFTLLTLAPGDPVDLLISSDPRVKPEDVIRLKHLYGLDQPIHIRYLKWLGRTVRGDLGFSRTYKEPVTELMQDRIGNSLWLTVTAFVLAIAVAVPVGIFSALHQYSALDYTATTFTLVQQVGAAPVFPVADTAAGAATTYTYGVTAWNSASTRA